MHDFLHAFPAFPAISVVQLTSTFHLPTCESAKRDLKSLRSVTRDTTSRNLPLAWRRLDCPSLRNATTRNFSESWRRFDFAHKKRRFLSCSSSHHSSLSSLQMHLFTFVTFAFLSLAAAVHGRNNTILSDSSHALSNGKESSVRVISVGAATEHHNGQVCTWIEAASDE